VELFSPNDQQSQKISLTEHRTGKHLSGFRSILITSDRYGLICWQTYKEQINRQNLFAVVMVLLARFSGIWLSNDLHCNGEIVLQPKDIFKL